MSYPIKFISIQAGGGGGVSKGVFLGLRVADGPITGRAYTVSRALGL